MTKYGFVASGGGYRSFYTAGALVALRKAGKSVVHVTSTSSGNNIVLDYLLWNWAQEDLPPTLTKTMRLSAKDIFDVFSNFLGLRPPLLPAGTHLFTVDKASCRKGLLLDDLQRRSVMTSKLANLRWDILATNLSKRQAQYFNVNELLTPLSDASLDRFMDVFLAGITTIPYFKAKKIDGDYFIEGGYTDNTPMRTLFENPEVDEIVAIDFTDYDYHRELDNLYQKQILTLPFNSIDMYLLVSDIQLTLPNEKVFSQAVILNEMLEAVGKDALEVRGKRYYRKPLHVLRPRDLESMTISLKDSRIQKEYFELGAHDTEQFLASQ